MKKFIIILLILFLLPLIYIIGVNIPYLINDNSITLNWGIEIPSDFKEIHKFSEKSFNGDGYRYTVYEEKNNRLEIIKDFEQVKSISMKVKANEIMNGLKVPMKDRPDLEGNYRWGIINDDKVGNFIIIIYFSEMKMYYFLESFM